MSGRVAYPYLPDGQQIHYVSGGNQFMRKARELARTHKSNLHNPAGAIIVRDGRVIGHGSIGDNDYHRQGCVRVSLNMPTGQGYELCPGCSPPYHSEPSAIRNAHALGQDTRGADLYLWGHWWCCKACWEAMQAAGIRFVYLLKDSEKLFNKDHPANILGRQFDTESSATTGMGT